MFLYFYFYLVRSFNGTYCVRCFHISVKSQNIVMIRLAGHTNRCFVSLQAAEASCPNPEQLETARQIILFSKCLFCLSEHTFSTCPIYQVFSFLTISTSLSPVQVYCLGFVVVYEKICFKPTWHMSSTMTLRFYCVIVRKICNLRPCSGIQ